MSELPNKFLAIDEEGFALSGETRLSDPAFGEEILRNLSWAPNRAFQSLSGGQKVLIEAFDAPLVARQVEKIESKWVLLFPYSFEASFDPHSLRLDEWDRFHGLTEQGIPFVMSRAAQAQFFDLIDDSDDDSITMDGERIELPGLYDDPADLSESAWDERYRDGDMGWNLDSPAEALKDMLPRLRLPKCRILVPGCGWGHDAAHFAKEGHVVTAMDLSDEALRGAKERYGHLPNLRFEKADILKLGTEHRSAYDLIFEHTLYCAVHPEDRQKLVRAWSDCLTATGQLMGVFFTMHKPSGPPFGASEWELRQRLQKQYRFLFWGRWQKSLPRRQGKELFVFASKR